MDLSAIIYGLGSGSLFTSRAFLPAFLTSLFLRFGDRLPFLEDLPLFSHVGNEPTWFTHGLTITILGVLTALEIAATKNPEAEEALETVDKYLKAGMALLSTLGVLTVADKGFIEKTVSPAAQEAGLLGALILPVVALNVFYMAGVRAGLREALFDADADDDLGLRGLLSWAEDSWVLIGTVVLVLYPLAMVLILGAVLGVMFLVRKHLEHREDAGRTPCESCGEPVYRCALQCQSCRHEVASPHTIGILGQVKDDEITDRGTHELDLVEKRRCPVCASRLKDRTPRQRCTQCGHEVFGTLPFRQRYTARVAGRLPLTLGVCALFSLIPVIGLIPGIIIYRLSLVAPFRRYLPLRSRFCLKWLLRLAMLILVSVQLVPIAGAAVVPVMAFLSYLLYSSSFRSFAEQEAKRASAS